MNSLPNGGPYVRRTFRRRLKNDVALSVIDLIPLQAPNSAKARRKAKQVYNDLAAVESFSRRIDPITACFDRLGRKRPAEQCSGMATERVSICQ
jgi:hypothetical protein